MAANSETAWQVPEPIAIREIQADAGTTIYLRRHGNPEGPRLVMCHGNGLAVDLYYPFWSGLLDDFDLVIYDLRNHGWNPVSSLDDHNIPVLISDHDRVQEAITEHFGHKPQVGVFHSVSALISLLSPARGSYFSALVLYDPPICKPGRGLQEFELASQRAAGMARRRTGTFKKGAGLLRTAPLLPAVSTLRARCI